MLILSLCKSLLGIGKLNELNILEISCRTCFIDKVDGLVRQETVRYVSLGRLNGKLYYLVRISDVVVLLVVILDALEDLDGILNGRLVEHDLLESSLKSRILLDLLILCCSRRAQYPEFASGECGLEDIGSIGGTFSITCADDSMKLIDYEDNVLSLDGFIDNALDSALELTSELSACDHSGKVKLPNLHIEELLGYRSFDDLHCQTLSDSCLTYARSADENRIVLAPSVKDLDAALDLGISADDAVDLAFLGALGEVCTEFVQILKTRAVLEFLAVLALLLVILAGHGTGSSAEHASEEALLTLFFLIA